MECLLIKRSRGNKTINKKEREMQCYKCHIELKDGIRSGAFGRYLCVDCFIKKWKEKPRAELIIALKEQLEFTEFLRNIKKGRLWQK